MSTSVDTRRTFVLLGASFSTKNMGVWALASSAIALVLHNFPDSRIILLDYGRKPDRCKVHGPNGPVEIEVVNLRFSWKVLLRNNIALLLLVALLLRLLPSRRLKEGIIDKNPWLSTIDRADLVGSIAGGDSFSDIYGLGRFLYVSLPQLLVLALGKPLVLLPQTLGPFRCLAARTIARSILRRARAVCVRDRESLEEGRELVGPNRGRLQLAHDMAFALSPIAPSGTRLAQLDRLEASRPLAGLNVSGLLYMGGYTRDNMFGLKADYRETIHAIIRHFAAQKVHVLLVPHVFGSGAGSESDLTASAAIYRSLAGECGGHLHCLEGDFNHHEVKYAIGKCDFFLGSRMHACIAALSQNIPAIGLAYSRKFRGVFATVGAEDLVIDLVENTQEQILGKVASAFERRQQIRERLASGIAHARRAVSGACSVVF